MSSANPIQRSEYTLFYDSTRQGGIRADLTPGWYRKCDQANFSEAAKELSQDITAMRTAAADQLSAAERYAAALAFGGNISNELSYGTNDIHSKTNIKQESMFLDARDGAFTTISKQGTVIGISAMTTAPNLSGTDLKTIQITRQDGFQLNLFLDENMRINDLEGGGLSVYLAQSGVMKIYDAEGNEISIDGSIDETGLGTVGDDIIVNLHSSLVDGGDGDDTIINLTDNVTISGGAGNDTIIVPRSAFKLTIDGGKGDDRILAASLEGSRIVMNEGSDELTSRNVLKSRIESGGDSTLHLGRMENSILSATGQSLTANITIVDSSTVDMNAQSNRLAGLVFSSSRISAGNGDNSISGNVAFSTQFVAGNGSNNFEFNAISDSKLIGGSGNDEIRILNYMHNSAVDAEAGDDYIYIGNMQDSRIYGGDGNDIMAVRRASGSQIEGGTGNDLIVAYGLGDSSVNGGGGNDTIISPSLSDNSANDTLHRWSWGTKWVDEFFKTAEQGSYESQRTSLNEALSRVDETAKESEVVAAANAKQMEENLRTKTLNAYKTVLSQSFNHV